MDDNGRRGTTITVLVTSFALLVYFFAFAQPLAQELTAMPRWVVDLPGGHGPATGDGRIPFSAGDRFGYYAEDGSVFFMDAAPGGAAVSERSWATMSPPRLHRADTGAAGATLEGLPFFSGG